MQQQIQKPRKPEEKSSLLEDKINNAFSQEEEVAVLETRTLELVYQSCCGCGCYDTHIQREVAGDSDLEDGDYVDDILEDDVILD